MYGKPSQPWIEINATLVQNGSVFQASAGISKNGIKLLINGMTWELMAPADGLNIFEKVKIEMKAGTAHGNNRITPKKRRNLMNGWFIRIARKMPRPTCKVVANRVQMTVHENTAPNVSR